MQKVWWRLLKWYAFFMLAASPVWKEVALSGRYIAHICPGRWFWFETGIRPSRGAPNCGGAGSSGGTTCHESNEDLESHRVTELRTVFISPDVESFWTASGNSRKAAWKLKLQRVRSLKVWSFSAQLERRFCENSSLPAMRFFGVNWEWHLDRNCADPRGSMKLWRTVCLFSIV